MEWTDKYITGIDEIDLQHNELFDIIDHFRLSIADPAKNSDPDIIKILKFLVNYTMFHFTAEEDYMKRINYSGYTTHKQIHDNFVSKLHSILKKIKAKEPYESIELYNFLLDWLKVHIAIEDQKYVKAGGKIKTLKTTLKNKTDILNIIIPNISKIEFLFNDDLISESERDIKRKKYLHSYYNGYKIGNLTDLYTLLESSCLLCSKKIISSEEDKELKKYICSKVDIDKKVLNEENHKTKTEVVDYLSRLGLYS